MEQKNSIFGKAYFFKEYLKPAKHYSRVHFQKIDFKFFTESDTLRDEFIHSRKTINKCLIILNKLIEPYLLQLRYFIIHYITKSKISSLPT